MTKENLDMRRLTLIVNFFGYSSFQGLKIGPMLGVICYLIIFQFSLSFYILYFAMLGTFVGVLLGGLNGAILSSITLLFRSQLTFNLYKKAMFFGAVILTAPFSYCLFWLILFVYSVKDVEHPNPVVLLATALATTASAIWSQSIISWNETILDGSKSSRPILN